MCSLCGDAMPCCLLTAPSPSSQRVCMGCAGHHRRGGILRARRPARQLQPGLSRQHLAAAVWSGLHQQSQKQGHRLCGAPRPWLRCMASNVTRPVQDPSTTMQRTNLLSDGYEHATPQALMRAGCTHSMRRLGPLGTCGDSPISVDVRQRCSACLWTAVKGDAACSGGACVAGQLADQRPKLHDELDQLPHRGCSQSRQAHDPGGGVSC